MQIDKNLYILISPFISFIFIGLLTFTISDVCAKEINEDNLYQIVNQPSKSDDVYNIHVGEGPGLIIGNIKGDKLYITNIDSGTISVISTKNDTKIKDIAVGGGPLWLLTHEDNKLYVSNSLSDTISVISTVNDTKIKDIAVGGGPVFLTKNYEDKLYVSNQGSETISVISTKNDTR